MPAATTALSAIRGRCQNIVGDTTTDIWTATADGGDWSNAINEAQRDILDDIIKYKAWQLCDALDDSLTITIVDEQEVYDYHALLTTATKTYYAFSKATWGNYQVTKYPWDRYNELKNGAVYSCNQKPYMSFHGDGTFYLRPLYNNGETFTFYFLKPLTVMDGDSEKPEIDERCIPMIRAKTCEAYYERRKRYKDAMYWANKYEGLVRKILKPMRVFRTNSVVSMD
jgi:hypothetical protein